MTKTNVDLPELLAKDGQGEVLRGIAEPVRQLIIQTDLEGNSGAARDKRSGAHTTFRH
jgi:hypothetical protein